MNRLLVIVGVALMIVALAFLNQGIHKIAPTEAEVDKQQQQLAQKQAEEAQKKNAPPDKPNAPGNPSAAYDALPSEETIGDPATAQHNIQVGWVYDEANQARPEILIEPLQIIRDYAKSSKGTISAEIVNLDVPAEDRSPAAQPVNDLGIAVDGNPVLAGSFSEMRAAAPDITKILDAAVGKK